MPWTARISSSTRAARRKASFAAISSASTTVGGPVWIPHLYNGRNKTFIFGDYEGTRIRQAVPFVDSVPTANERNSGFTNYQDLITYQSGTQKDLVGAHVRAGAGIRPRDHAHRDERPASIPRREWRRRAAATCAIRFRATSCR